MKERIKELEAENQKLRNTLRKLKSKKKSTGKRPRGMTLAELEKAMDFAKKKKLDFSYLDEKETKEAKLKKSIDFAKKKKIDFSYLEHPITIGKILRQIGLVQKLERETKLKHSVLKKTVGGKQAKRKKNKPERGSFEALKEAAAFAHSKGYKYGE